MTFNDYAVAQKEPKMMTVRKPNGKKQRVVGQPKFLFEMAELFNAGKLPVKKE